MDAAGVEALRDAIRGLHGCEASFVDSVPVVESFRGETAWEGEVAVFDVTGHPGATRCYAWSHAVPGSERRRFVAVLEEGPIKGARDAVRTAIAQEIRGHVS